MDKWNAHSRCRALQIETRRQRVQRVHRDLRAGEQRGEIVGAGPDMVRCHFDGGIHLGHMRLC